MSSSPYVFTADQEKMLEDVLEEYDEAKVATRNKMARELMQTFISTPPGGKPATLAERKVCGPRHVQAGRRMLNMLFAGLP